MVAAFGNTLHVTGTDPEALAAAIKVFRDDPRYTWEPAKPSLEDVFIHTLATSEGDKR
jgi:ABC-2 type transport system ATP-binding protein